MSYKVKGCRVIEKQICNFLLVINSNLCRISHCLATVHPLKAGRWQRWQGCHAAQL